jgi:hypothetical protein
MCISPARLFAVLYGSNLLMNGSFLERLNSHKGPHRRLVWVSQITIRPGAAAVSCNCSLGVRYPSSTSLLSPCLTLWLRS